MFTFRLWLCFAILLHCFSIGKLSGPIRLLEDHCPAGALDCPKLKRQTKDEKWITCKDPDSTCAPVYDCPEAMRDLESFDNNRVKEVQLRYCGERWTTKYVCCYSVQPRDVLQVSKYSRFLLLGYCGRGGTSLLDRDIHQSLIEVENQQETDPQNDNQQGRDASINARMGQFPWIAVLHYPGDPITPKDYSSYACMGSIITKRFILTASFCFFRTLDGSLDRFPSYASVGEYDITKVFEDENVEYFDGRSRSILKIKPQLFEIASHYRPDASADDVPPKLFMDDIALVKIRGEMQFNLYVQPICLPTESETPEDIFAAPEKYGTGVGYAFSSERSDLGILRRDVLEMDTTENCLFPYPLSLEERNITVHPSNTSLCVRSVDRTPVVCGNDMGSPLMQQAGDGRMFLVGVNNYPGFDDCSMSHILFYTKVEPFMQWIVYTIEVYSSL